MTAAEVGSHPGWTSPGDHHHSHSQQTGRAGMIALLCSEAAFFATLIVTYLLFLGQDSEGPTPKSALSLPLAALNSVFLLSSSATLFMASSAFVKGQASRSRWWLAATVLLGSLFLAGTAFEWKSLIYEHGLTIATNLFGTSYYMLIGCHAVHVTVGLLCMLMLIGLLLAGLLPSDSSPGFLLIEWYWHFVDGVWVVLFLVVYVLGR